MAVTINASSVSGLQMTSDLSGVLTFQQNGVSLPNGGVAPAFSAYRVGTQSITSSTWTKVQLSSEEFDTNSNYDNATNYRFTPTVAGYYQVNGSVKTSGSSISYALVGVYKNGVIYKEGCPQAYTATAQNAPIVSCLVYLNGSTDYIELYGFVTAGAGVGFDCAQVNTYFQACLVRGA
jgi:hypothetical protein